ncbi:hypothetical protein AJ80_09222 [Polytolypa hystricis UAMH7299]|uniref:Uncharacterized protein n=1 Tax=Polytolypa hystricis (strain UAMH7299) TaxID=1447883 RepID=A0A2B7WU93_POLH7|nr:hypothetical protein AJ80_09222 [Polytolypa hystricis UAMH7299]
MRKKRSTPIPLSRTAASPSRQAQIRKIFRNAQQSLHRGLAESPRAASSRIPRWKGSPNSTSSGTNTVGRRQTFPIPKQTGDGPKSPINNPAPAPLFLPSVQPIAMRHDTGSVDVPTTPNEGLARQAHIKGKYLSTSSSPKKRKSPLLSHHSAVSDGRTPPEQIQLARTIYENSVSYVSAWLDGLAKEEFQQVHNQRPSDGREEHSGGHVELTCMPQPSTCIGSDKGTTPQGCNSGQKSTTKSSTSDDTLADASMIPIPETPVLVRKPPPRSNHLNRDSGQKISPSIAQKRTVAPPRSKQSANLVPIHSQSSRHRRETPNLDRGGQHGGLSSRRALSELQNGIEIQGLSPHVTPFRKGKGPKRERCPSYYDEDILGPQGQEIDP